MDQNVLMRSLQLKTVKINDFSWEKNIRLY